MSIFNPNESAADKAKRKQEAINSPNTPGPDTSFFQNQPIGSGMEVEASPWSAAPVAAPIGIPGQPSAPMARPVGINQDEEDETLPVGL